MATRKQPNVTVAAIELGLIVVALLAGRFVGSWLAFGALAIVATGWWVWTRRPALARMKTGAQIAQAGVAIAVMGAILGGAFWLGLTWRGT